MEDSRVEVGMGEGLIAGSPAVVSSEGIGSCVVLILYDSGRRIGGVAHIMLPIVNRNPDHERRRFGPDAGSAPGYEKRQSERAFSPYQYADSALCALLDGMAEMGSAGDTKIMWSKDNTDEIEAARKQFNELKAKGFTAFRVVGKSGDKGEPMDTFDPDAERVILTKPMRGG